MNERPEPLAPPDLDLRDFRWMKLDLIALFNSDFNSTPDDTAWRAGVTLWGKAWHQVPAGSLPDDDPKLCNLSGLGRDLKTWARIREVALHGFVKCSDGRLYHKFLCQRAIEADEERRRFEARKSKDRERKKVPPSDGIPAEIPPNPPKPSTGIPAENAVEGAEREKEEIIGGAHAPPDTAAGVIECFDQACRKHFGPTNARPWPGATDHVYAGRFLAAGADIPLLTGVFDGLLARFKADGQPPPAEIKIFEKWVAAAIRDRDAPPAEARYGNVVSGTKKAGRPALGDQIAELERLRTRPAVPMESFAESAGGAVIDQPARSH